MRESASVVSVPPQKRLPVIACAISVKGRYPFEVVVRSVGVSGFFLTLPSDTSFSDWKIYTKSALFRGIYSRVKTKFSH